MRSAVALAGADNRPMHFSRRTVGIAASVVTVAIWTGFIIIGRASAAHTLRPFDIGFLRVLGALLAVLPWALWHRARDPQARRTGALGGLSPLPWRQTAAIGLAGGTVYSLLCYAGFFYAPAAHAAVLLPGSQPLWAALLAVPLLGERLTRGRLGSLLCIVLGAAAVGAGSVWAALGSSGVWKGDLIFLCAAVCWALYGVLVRRYQLNAVRATVALGLFGALSYLPIYGLLVASGMVTSGLGAAPWREIVLQLLFQGVCLVGVAGLTFVTMIRIFGPVRSTMITALVPGLSALGAALFLGEALAWNSVAGVALVTLGIVLGVRAKSAGRAGHDEVAVRAQVAGGREVG